MNEANTLKLITPTIPTSVCGRLSFGMICPLSDEEISCFNLALQLFAIELEKNPPPFDIAQAKICCVDVPYILITTRNKVLGNWFSLATYYMGNIREKRYEPIKLVAIILEELCHCFWSISDEYLVKVIVLDALHFICPGLKLGDVFDEID